MAAASTAASDLHWVYGNSSLASPAPPIHGFFPIFNPELLQLPLNGPYGHPNSLPVSAMMPPNTHHHHLPFQPSNYCVNGTVTGTPSYSLHHDSQPDSAPLDSANLEFSAHSIPDAQHPTPIPAPTLHIPASFNTHHQIQAYGMRWGKGPRAQQVR